MGLGKARQIDVHTVLAHYETRGRLRAPYLDATRSTTPGLERLRVRSKPLIIQNASIRTRKAAVLWNIMEHIGI